LVRENLILRFNFASLFNTICKANKRMENNRDLSKDHEAMPIVSMNKNKLYCAAALMGALFLYQNTQAQEKVFVNKGLVQVDKGTILSIHYDFINDATGEFNNDGDTYIQRDWLNNGIVGFSTSGSKAPSNGTTYFIGKDYDTKKSLVQTIDGELRSVVNNKKSDFQNIYFENGATDSPAAFYLNTQISVAKTATFKKGIIEGADLGGVDADGVDFDGRMIFEKDATHELANNESFVDGKVEKIGKAEFEFPVGDNKYFRPSYHNTGLGDNDAYTTQYFNKDSDNLHSHSSKQDGIQVINNSEYWIVTQNKGTGKIVLSLSLDSSTTPTEFLNVPIDKKVVIVRWDITSNKWVNEGGEVEARKSYASAGAEYTQLIMTEVNLTEVNMTQVKGYDMFTLAIVDKVDKPELIVYNAVSPNGDGMNDTFHIKGIDKYPDNTVEIYNRWGVKVYDTNGYNESNNMFAGYSDGRATVKRGEKLPTGTYFYIIKYNNGSKVIEQAGYLYINNQ